MTIESNNNIKPKTNVDKSNGDKGIQLKPDRKPSRHRIKILGVKQLAKFWNDNIASLQNNPFLAQEIIDSQPTVRESVGKTGSKISSKFLPEIKIGMAGGANPTPLATSKTPDDYNLLSFEKIQAKDFVPAIKAICKYTKKEYIDPALKLLKTNDKLTFENAVMPFIRMQEEIYKVYISMSNLNSLKKTDDIKEAFEEAKEIYTRFMNNNFHLNKKAYELVKKYSKSDDVQKLPGPQKKYLKELIEDFERGGIALSDRDRKRLSDIDVELSSLGTQFGNNVTNSAVKLVIEDEKDLKGLPDSVKKQGKDYAKILRENGHAIPKDAWVFGTSDRPAYDPFMKYSPDGELRKKLYMAYLGRAKENEAIINKQFKLKLEKAQILGFKNYAEYNLQKQMLNTPEKVLDFMNELHGYIKDKAQEEYNELVKMKLGLLEKVEMTKAETNEPDDKVQIWDQFFLAEKVKKVKADFDPEKELKPYFELESCKQGMFDIANRLYGVSFKKVFTDKVWDKGVEVYEVRDENDKAISYLYLDLYKRHNTKDQNAWCLPLEGAYKLKDGSRNLPKSVLVCNFDKPSNGQKALLTHRELETLFHEFGHAMHGLLSKTDLSVQSGTKTERDFVELPSQLMEKWANEYEALKLYAKHYQTGKVLPEKLFNKLKESSKFYKAMEYIRLIERGMLDLKFYNRNKDDGMSALDIDRAVRKEYGFYDLPEGANYPNMFEHIFKNNYDSKFYSYKWSDVLVAGVEPRFDEAGILNRAMGKEYQETVYEKGGSETGIQMFRNLTGKDPEPIDLARKIGAFDLN